MQTLCEKNLCSGCGACAAKCPKHCITMLPDDEGFLYPEINRKECIDCGLCEKVCPVMHPPALSGITTDAYAAVNVNDRERMASTSGGIFTLLSRWVLQRNGVVFGAAYADDHSVLHRWVDTEKELAQFRGAKYSQSRIGNSYIQVEAFLRAGRYVLFSGTPCQVCGLKNYLGKEFDRLVCVDLICHSVPSPKVWQRYIDYRAKMDCEGVRPTNINLRSKVTGWPAYSVLFEYGTDTYSCLAGGDPYIKGFVSGLFSRNSCYHCAAKGIERASDLTLGDYWGIAVQHPEMHDEKGTSLVLVHSLMGKQLWNDISGQIKAKQVDPVAAVSHNPMATNVTPIHPKREEFFLKYQAENFAALVQELVNQEPIERMLLCKKIWCKTRMLLKRILAI